MAVTLSLSWSGSRAQAGESLSGRAGADAINLSAEQSALQGNVKADALQGSAKADALQGKVKTDALQGSAKADALQGKVKTDALQGGAKTDALQGNVKTDALQGGAKTDALQGWAAKPVLQGGVKDDAALHSSLNITPGSTQKNPQLNSQIPSADNGNSKLNGDVDQFAGGVHKAGPFPNMQPQNPVAQPFPVSHPIPPLSTYFAPRSGVVNYVPGYGVPAPAVPVNQSRTFAPYEFHSTSSRGGVTTYGDNYVTKPVSTVTSSTTYNMTPQFSSIQSVNGVTTYGDKYDLVRNPGFGMVNFKVQQHTDTVTSRSGISTYQSGYGVTPGASSEGITAYRPGFHVSINSGTAGVVCWQPGFSVEHGGTPGGKETLSGLWSTPNKTQPEGLTATAQRLFPTPMFAQVEVPPVNQGLKASGLLLPGAHPVASDAKLTWPQWYKAIGEAISMRWQQVDVGPGSATVRITVTRDRRFSCRVEDFHPAPYAETDAAAQQAFCEAAKNTVYLVSQFEIPSFPPNSNLDSVTFYADMNRNVDGPSGFHIANTH